MGVKVMPYPFIARLTSKLMTICLVRLAVIQASTKFYTEKLVSTKISHTSNLWN